jgi:hypothetical protein
MSVVRRATYFRSQQMGFAHSRAKGEGGRLPARRPSDRDDWLVLDLCKPAIWRLGITSSTRTTEVLLHNTWVGDQAITPGW